jgi:hypothetical protein
VLALKVPPPRLMEALTVRTSTSTLLTLYRKSRRPRSGGDSSGVSTNNIHITYLYWTVTAPAELNVNVPPLKLPEADRSAGETTGVR